MQKPQTLPGSQTDNGYVTKFFVAAVIFFLVGTAQGGLQSLYHEALEALPLHGLIVSAHSHLGTTGWASLALIGIVYLALPMTTKKPIFSVRLANVGFWFFAIPLAVAYVLEMMLALTAGAIPILGLMMTITLPVLGVGVWIFIANVFLTVGGKKA